MDNESSSGLSVEIVGLNRIPDERVPSGYKCGFAYTMKIYNYSLENVRLLSRKWMIRQFDGSLETVEGDGVVGEQPHMEPGESHVYTSYCLLTGEHGSMWGFYFGKDDNEIPVIWRIPRFDMSIEGNGSA